MPPTSPPSCRRCAHPHSCCTTGGDRVIPHRGGLQLAEGLPDARLVTLEGRYHLPDIRDLHHIVDTIATFLSTPP